MRMRALLLEIQRCTPVYMYMGDVTRDKEKCPLSTLSRLILAKICELFFETDEIDRYIRYMLGYLKDSNAAAHSVDTGIS